MSDKEEEIAAIDFAYRKMKNAKVPNAKQAWQSARTHIINSDSSWTGIDFDVPGMVELIHEVDEYIASLPKQV